MHISPPKTTSPPAKWRCNFSADRTSRFRTPARGKLMNRQFEEDLARLILMLLAVDARRSRPVFLSPDAG
jgi:hypothetical protein